MSYRLQLAACAAAAVLAAATTLALVYFAHTIIMAAVAIIETGTTHG